MANIRLENVTKRFGRVEAVTDLTLEVRDKEFFCILGPPGAGKTTTLRLIVGLERPDEGQIFIDDWAVNDVHPRKRDIAMIFQNLALYPDKSVFDNIAFPLRERRLAESEVRERVTAVARTLRIEPLLQRKPAKLSGGERQRVAIGRAIVRRPRAYLMDEPLANLDALLRLEMRVELKHLQKDLGQTLVYVTHDQIEALSMADRIAVMHLGHLQQCATPEEIYNRPANRFVATVIGSPPMNFILCQLHRDSQSAHLQHEVFRLRANGGRHPLAERLADSGYGQEEIFLGVRPEDIQLHTERPSHNAVPARVSVLEPLGSETVVDTHLGGEIISVVVPPTQKLSEGQEVWATLNLDKVHLFATDSNRRIYTSGSDQGLLIESRAGGG